MLFGSYPLYVLLSRVIMGFVEKGRYSAADCPEMSGEEKMDPFTCF